MKVDTEPQYNGVLSNLFLVIGNKGKGNAYKLRFQSFNGYEFAKGYIGTISILHKGSNLQINILGENIPNNESTLVICYENEFGEEYIQEVKMLLTKEVCSIITCTMLNILQPKLVKQSQKK